MPDEHTGRYAELRERAEIAIANGNSLARSVIRDLLAALDEMQGVVERIATGDNECLTRGDFEELAQAALAARKGE